MHAPTRPAIAAGLAVFALTAIIHVAGSWIPSFWYDEGATLRLAALTWDEFFAFVQRRDAVHAVYAAFMHVWTSVFGATELSARMPSALAAAFGALGVHVLARRLGASPGGSVVAGLVFGLMPRVLLQGIEARSYSIATALIVAAALLAVRTQSSRLVGGWIAYVVVAALAVWVFAYNVLVLPALVVLGASGSWTIRGAVTRVALIVGVPAALALPLAGAMSAQRGQVAWLDDVPLTAWSLLVEPLFGWAVWLAVAFAALVVVDVIRGGALAHRHALALWLWLGLPGVVLVIVTVVAQPVFAPRYLAITAPAAAVMVGLAVSGWSRRGVTAAALVWALGAVPVWISGRAVDAKPGATDFRAIAQVIEHGAAPGDGFVLGVSGVGALRPRTVLAVYPEAFEGLTDVAFVRPFTATGTFWDDVRMVEPDDVRGIPRVWVATRGESSEDAGLREAGFVPTSVAVIDGIEVVRWDAPAGD